MIHFIKSLCLIKEAQFDSRTIFLRKLTTFFINIALMHLTLFLEAGAKLITRRRQKIAISNNLLKHTSSTFYIMELKDNSAKMSLH